MAEKAQSALEYLMTYGWTLIVVVIIAGTILLVFEPWGDSSGKWTSNSLEMLLKDAVVSDGSSDNVTLVLQNAAASNITVTKVELSEGFVSGGTAKLNGRLFSPGNDISISVDAGEDLLFEEIDAPEGFGDASITISYISNLGLSKTAVIQYFKNGGSESSREIKEDAENGDTGGWAIYDNSPEGATISNVFDSERGNNVIEFNGAGTSNGYRIGYPVLWDDYSRFTVQWKMKYSESFTVYISVTSTAGHRYIYYTNAGTDALGDGGYVHHGLGSGTIDGQWHTITRSLEADLHDAQPTVDIIKVNSFLVRGSGRVDDIILIE